MENMCLEAGDGARRRAGRIAGRIAGRMRKMMGECGADDEGGSEGTAVCEDELENAVCAAACIMAFMCGSACADAGDCAGERAAAVMERIAGDGWRESLLQLYEEFTAETCEDTGEEGSGDEDAGECEDEGFNPEDFLSVMFVPLYIREGGDCLYTPESLIKLGAAVLDIGPGDVVADICCSTGAFYINAAAEQREASYYGFDMNRNSIDIASAKACIAAPFISGNIHASVRDVFTLFGDRSLPEFSKVFANYPFGLKVGDMDKESEFYRFMKSRCPEISDEMSMDWMFTAISQSILSDGGKAVSFVSRDAVFCHKDAPLRKYFIENSMIESAVRLPEKMFPNTDTEVYMITLKGGSANDDYSDGIILMDASEKYDKGCHNNELANKIIVNIADSLRHAENREKIIKNGCMACNDWILDVNHYDVE